MKNIVCFLLIISGVYAQENIPTEFWKIGFGDMYKLTVEFNPPCIPLYEQYGYYYDKFAEASFTHLVTPADGVPFTYQNTMKIMDENMRRDFRNDTSFYPYVYGLSPGNGPATGDEKELPYEVGGERRAVEISALDNWGFGTEETVPGLSNDATFSHWIGYVQPGELIGDQNKFDGQPYNVRTAYANVNANNEGFLLKAWLDPLHQDSDKLRDSYPPIIFYYKLIIKARIEGAGGNDIVATVRIYEETNPVNEDYSYCYSYQRNRQEINEDPTDITYNITAGDFNGNNYTELPSPYFRKTMGRQGRLHIDVLWKDIRSMYIDKFYVFNQYYEKLYS